MTNMKIGDYTTATLPLDGTEEVELQTSAPASRKCATLDIANLVPKPIVVLQVAASDETTALTVTGTPSVTFRAPYAFTLTGVRAALSTASSSGLPTFDIKKNGTSVLSTLLSINASAKTSVGATTPAVISTTAVASDDEFTVYITVDGTGATGAKIMLLGTPS